MNKLERIGSILTWTVSLPVAGWLLFGVPGFAAGVLIALIWIASQTTTK